MAVPTYATDLTLIDDAELASNYTALGGGASGLNDETDYFIENTQCVSKSGFTASTKGFITNTGTHTVASGDAIFVWGKQNNRNLMDTIANGGMQFLVGDSTSAYDHFYVDGSDSEGSALAGWRTYAVDPTQTPSTSTGTPTTTNRVGFLWKILGSGSLKGAPNAKDVSRHGRELTSINGQAGAYATFDGAATFDSATARAWGILTPIPGGYQMHGAFVMGTTATSVDFRDSNRSIVILDDPFLPAGFNEFEIRNASSNVEWTNIVIQHLGAAVPAVLTFDVGTFTGDSCQFTGCATTTFASTGTCTNTTWTGCEPITAAGATLTDSSVFHGSKIIDAQDETNYDNSPTTEGTFSGGIFYAALDTIILANRAVVTVDAVSSGIVTQFTVDASRATVWPEASIPQISTDGAGGSFSLTPDTGNYTESSGLIWNTAADPDGELDGMTFDTLTPPMTHAIEFGLSSPLTMTLRNIDFGTNYSATAGGSVGNETFHFKRTSGTVTLNLVGCTGNFGYKTDGATIVIVEDPVTLTVTVKDTATPPVAIQNARVLVEASDGAGPLPYQDAVSIVQTAGTATVTHTAHGLATGNYIVIRGATQNGYNKVASITVTGANTYTYSVDSGTVSPATGSPVATAAIISGLTNASGVISDTRTYSGNQNFSGRARKSTSSPYYKTGDFTGTVNSATGAAVNLQLLDDE